MATKPTTLNTDKATYDKVYDLYWADKVNKALSTVTDKGGTVNVSSTPKPTWTSVKTGWSAWPVVTTTSAREEVKNNGAYIDSKIKTVVNTNTSGNKITTTYSDGTSETKDIGVNANTWTPDRTQLLDETKNIYSEQEKLQNEIAGKYDALKVSGDQAYNQLVENTKTQFAGLRTQLTDSNKRFEAKTSQGQYLNNGFRYTPQASEGMVYDAEQAGLAKLGDLNLKESQALQMALAAKNADDYAALAQYTDDVRAIQQDRINTITQMTNQIKTIEDTDKNIRNMNQNEANFMQSMIDSYILTAGDMDAAKTEEYYKKQSKELSELMGFNVAPEFIKAQVESAKASAKLEVNDALTKANGFYTDSLGRALTDLEGKRIPFNDKEDWGTWVEGNMLNVGTYDENGNKVMKTYELKWGTKSYAETLAEMPPTQTNITVKALAEAYTWPMSELLMTAENTFIPTTNPAYKNIGNGGMQCAEFVNRVTGTSFESGKAANVQPASTLWVGSIASWAPAGAGKYEHAGIIVWQEGDNWIIKSVNLRWNGIVSIDTIPKSVIKWGYTPDSVKNMPMEVSGVYDPNQDKNLTPIGTNKDGSGIFLDNKTNKTISEGEAKALYGDTKWNMWAVTDIKSLWQFMKDNQQMWSWYSEKDVERFDEKIDRYIANWDTKSMAKAYREMLLRDTDFKKEFDNTQKFTQALDDVDAMIKQYETAGKSTNALKAMAEKVARKLWITTDTALAQLQTQMWFTLANYIRSISGTAASDVEVQRLMGNMASIGNVQELNTALVSQARQNATSALKSMVDTRMYGLPEELKPQVFGDIYDNTPPQTQTETEYVDFSSI